MVKEKKSQFSRNHCDFTYYGILRSGPSLSPQKEKDNLIIRGPKRKPNKSATQLKSFLAYRTNWRLVSFNWVRDFQIRRLKLVRISHNVDDYQLTRPDCPIGISVETRCGRHLSRSRRLWSSPRLFCCCASRVVGWGTKIESIPCDLPTDPIRNRVLSMADGYWAEATSLHRQPWKTPSWPSTTKWQNANREWWYWVREPRPLLDDGASNGFRTCKPSTYVAASVNSTSLTNVESAKFSSEVKQTGLQREFRINNKNHLPEACKGRTSNRRIRTCFPALFYSRWRLRSTNLTLSCGPRLLGRWESSQPRITSSNVSCNIVHENWKLLNDWLVAWITFLRDRDVTVDHWVRRRVRCRMWCHDRRSGYDSGKTYDPKAARANLPGHQDRLRCN